LDKKIIFLIFKIELFLKMIYIYTLYTLYGHYYLTNFKSNEISSIASFWQNERKIFEKELSWSAIAVALKNSRIHGPVKDWEGGEIFVQKSQV